MKRIPLTQGQFALVDDDDFDWLMLWKWRALRDGNTWYAVRSRSSGPRPRKMYLMHAVIGGNIKTDHKNGNGLDNQRHNLRPASNQQNAANQLVARKNNTSGFKGVTFRRDREKWKAQIRVANRLLFLGLFQNREEAARAYNRAATKFFGEYARLNPV